MTPTRRGRPEAAHIPSGSKMAAIIPQLGRLRNRERICRFWLLRRSKLQCENSVIVGVSPTVGAGRPHDSRRDGGATGRRRYKNMVVSSLICNIQHSPLDLRRGKNLNIRGGIEWERRNHGSLSRM